MTYVKLLLLIVCFVACKKQSIEINVGFTSIDVPSRIIIDTAYGSDNKQKIDLYLPKGRSNLNTPLLALIHDGQWSSGDKSQLRNTMQIFQNKLPHFAFALINYRLFNNDSNFFPTQEKDIVAALNFLKLSGDSLGYKFITTYGEGAGGHLSLLCSFKLGKQFISAATAINSPLDLVDIYNSNYNQDLKWLLQSVIGNTPQNSPFYNSSSPINFINSNTPPVQYIHGQTNGVIAVQQAQLFKNKLVQNSINHSLVILPNQGHRLSNDLFLYSIELIGSFLDNKLLYK